MNEYKSMDYLQQLVNDYGKADTQTMLESIAYMLMDNGYTDARMFIDSLNEIVEDEL